MDDRYGGYVLSLDEKQLATQSRMVWAFSHAHLSGLGDYLGAAERGVEFLLQRFSDATHGGFYWKTDREGQPLDERKYLYGHLFTILAFIEYARAGGDAHAVDSALALFYLLHERAHDNEFGGWLEDFGRDWEPIAESGSGGEVEIPGLKSANVHLHAVEALTALYVETGAENVADLLAETMDVCTAHFHPLHPHEASSHRRRDWKPAGRPAASVGHNIEFAWLLIGAEGALGRDASWQRLDSYLEQALAPREEPLLWWETAETLAALATAVAHRRGQTHLESLDRLLTFALAYQVDPCDGVWHYSVAADGAIVNSAKIGTWKDAFHETRATVLLRTALD